MMKYTKMMHKRNNERMRIDGNDGSVRFKVE